LSGNSILLTRLALEIEQHFCKVLRLSDLLASPTIENIAQLLSSDRNKPLSNQFIQDSVLNQTDCLYPQHTSNRSTLNFFLTGVTGFLGIHLLFELHQYTQAILYCLIRAQDYNQAKHRLNETLIRYGFVDLVQSERILPICGDLSRENLGLSSDLFLMLSCTIDVIYHNGAQVNHIYDYRQLKPSNVDSTLALLRLATTHHLKKIHFVSTIGAVAHGNIVEESLASSESRPLLNCGYLQTKWVSERLLTQAYERGVPVYIYRPSWICGNSHSGQCNPNGNHLLHLLKACIQIGYAPDFNINLNFLPVDFLSHAIVKLSLSNIPSVFNLFNLHTFTWNQLIDWVSDAGYPIALIPYSIWHKKIFKNLSSNCALYPFASLYRDKDDTGWFNLHEKLLKVSMNQTHDALEQIRLLYPPINHALIHNCLKYLKQIDFL
jgi:thioester reductase-like protein